MNIFKVETPCIIKPLQEHKQIKKPLISLIKKTKSDFLKENNKYYGDLIHRLDWNDSQNFSREWVKFLKPYLQKYFNDCAKKLGYQKVNIINLWFQQYNKNGKHGWHIHSENYTGVYYLKFSNKDAKTELIDPFTKNKKIIINSKEGDIVIFPSYIIHRATEQKDDCEKIIISFNINFDSIDFNLFEKIDNLKGINSNEFK
tara:strand:- start:837 stop:1439 length:603 start_codon:yes stop_codon:yes gene_type:complete